MKMVHKKAQERNLKKKKKDKKIILLVYLSSYFILKNKKENTNITYVSFSIVATTELNYTLE